MPVVQYSCPRKGINECRRIDAPKALEDAKAWLHEAFRVFPEAPRNYTLRRQLVDFNVICFEFISNKHEKFALVIAHRAR